MIDKPEPCVLVKCSVIDGSPNSKKIIHAMDDVMKDFRVRRVHVSLLICDAAVYICPAGTVLKEKYLELLHVICVVHLTIWLPRHICIGDT